MSMDSRALNELVVDAIDEMKGQNVVELDVSQLTDVTDRMVIASGRSDRQVRAIAQNVVEKAKAAGVQPLGVEGMDRCEWVLVDLCDVVVHVMQPDTRDYYQLEKLWTGLDEELSPEHPVSAGERNARSSLSTG
jgi:ribosome-associated protein